MTRRDELLDLASTVLEAEGLEKFGVGALARAAGIRPPSLYKHFTGIEDIEAALISRGFTEFGRAVEAASLDAAADVGGRRAAITAFARAYRAGALTRPQHYRLMTERPLRRDLLAAGSEVAAMRGILAVFDETVEHHDRARAAWAWAHGLASLEIAERFPPGADVDAAWGILVDTLAG